MLLHIGNDVSVPLDGLICILNGVGLTEDSARCIARVKERRRYRPCEGKPRSYVLVRERGRETVYASPIAAATLEKRLKNEISHAWLRECAVRTVLED